MACLHAKSIIGGLSLLCQVSEEVHSNLQVKHVLLRAEQCIAQTTHYEVHTGQLAGENAGMQS